MVVRDRLKQYDQSTRTVVSQMLREAVYTNVRQEWAVETGRITYTDSAFTPSGLSVVI